MSVLDNYSHLNYFKNILGVKSASAQSTVPTYIKMCKLKRFANNLTEDDIEIIENRGFHFYMDEVKYQDRLSRIKDEIMQINDNDKINMVYGFVLDGMDILTAICILFQLR